MDKETEFEVIDILHKFASLTFLYGGRVCFTYEELKKYQKAVRDMLNLYEKEKQAVRTKIIGKIDQVSLDDLIGDEYVRKDKIRAKIEELNNEFNERNSHEEDFNYNYGEEYAFAEEKLKEVLEEK